MTVLQSFNPATGALVGEVEVTPVEQIPALVAQARLAQVGWAALEASERAQILQGSADYFLDRADELGKLATQEMGKPLARGIGEVKACGRGLEPQLTIAQFSFLTHLFDVQGLDPQRQQLCSCRTLLSLQLFESLGSPGLTLQMRKLLFDLVTQVGQPFQVIPCMSDSVLGFPSAFLVFGDPGCLFEKRPELLGLRFNQARDHALFDNRIAVRAQTGAEQYLRDVFAPTPRTIEIVLRCAVAAHDPTNGNFSVTGVCAGDGTVAVVKDQLDTGLPNRFAPPGAVEYDIGH